MRRYLEKRPLLLVKAALLCGALAALAACPAGRGEGWVVGKLWVENCDNGEPLGESLDRPAEFDLQTDFFAGETKEDSNKSPDQRNSSLTIRIQDTSNNVEVSNGLVLQILDLSAAARALAGEQPLPVSSRDLICTGTACTQPVDVVRAKLYLYAACPNCKQPMVGASYKLEKDPQNSSCNIATTKEAPRPCPTLSSKDQKFLRSICEAGDFSSKASQIHLRQTLGDGACLFLCDFGEARPGQNLNDLSGFTISYGDRVTGLFSLNIVDGRSAMLHTCARAAGAVQGMFSFEVTRGRAVQSFP